MTDLVRYEGPPPTSLELAPQAWKLAEKIADTDFVPKSLRGRKEAVLACILAGHEAGVPPMASLSKIHIIEGRPAMAAELMRALVVQHGHELNFDNVSNTSVTITGKRRGGTRETSVTWTLDDAKAAGLTGKEVWRKYPRAMLIARATAEICRMMFPDVLAGVSYTVEELSDGELVVGDLLELGTPPPPAPPAAPRTGKAKAAAAITRAAPADDPAPAPTPARGDVPGLPGEDEDPITDAEIVDPTDGIARHGADQTDPAHAGFGDGDPPIVDADVVDTSGSATLAESAKTGNGGTEHEDDWPSGDWGTSPDDQHPPVDQRRFTGPQLIAIKLGDLFGIKGNTADARQLRLDAIARIGGRVVGSSKELTAEETASLLATLEAWPEGEPLPPATVEPDGGGSEPSEPAEADGATDPPPAPPAPRARPGTIPPEQWDADKWRATLRDRSVKVTEAMREAQRLAGALDPPAVIGTLDDVAGSGIAADLLGYVEDLSLERKATK